MDARGVSVRLSHFCPTAASLLFTHEGPLSIVEGPPALPDGGRPEGLDAQDALPPLLNAGVLADFDGYSAWEAHVVSWLGGSRNPAGAWFPESVVAGLGRHIDRLRAWRPGDVALRDWVTSLGETAPIRTAPEPDWPRERWLFDAARQAVPPVYGWPEFPAKARDRWQTVAAPHWPDVAAIVNRYLAGHAFASWLPYLGLGLSGVVSEAATALAVVRAECLRECSVAAADLDAEILRRAVRQADLLLCHLADRQALARALLGQP